MPTLLRLLDLGRTGAASVAEQRLHRLLRSAGLDGRQANVPLHDGVGLIAVADVLFTETRLVIEVDGFAAHRGRGRFVADRRRQNRLVTAGYNVLRVTWGDLRDRPDAVLAEIRQLLERSPSRPSPPLRDSRSRSLPASCASGAASPGRPGDLERGDRRGRPGRDGNRSAVPGHDLH